MRKTHRFSAAIALIVSLAGSGWSETVFAQEVNGVEIKAQQMTPLGTGPLMIGPQTIRAMTAPPASAFGTDTLAQRRGWYGGRRRNGAAQAEMVLGAVAMIAGAAVLTYANRPECSMNAAAQGCSYGNKVVGTAVATAGVVTFLTGALTWR